MSTTARAAWPAGGPDPYRLGRSREERGKAAGRSAGGPAPKRVVVGYGFWIFLLSDIIMFSAFFAAHAVLQDAYADGPTGAQLFDVSNVQIETACLLASSFVCGLAAVATHRKSLLWTEVFLLLTGLLGAAFLALELREFAGMVAHGAGPGRSAYLSSFFAVVGLHGLHVTVGLLWLGTMMAQVWARGFKPVILRRLLCFNLFWHALDIIWVALFTVVYLIGGGT